MAQLATLFVGLKFFGALIAQLKRPKPTGAFKLLVIPLAFYLTYWSLVILFALLSSYSAVEFYEEAYNLLNTDLLSSLSFLCLIVYSLGYILEAILRRRKTQ